MDGCMRAPRISQAFLKMNLLDLRCVTVDVMHRHHLWYDPKDPSSSHFGLEGVAVAHNEDELRL